MNRKQWLLLFVAMCALLLSVVAFLLLRRSRTRCPIIMISIDTLRADHLGCYGYHRNVSPAVDRFCRDSVRFSCVIAQAPSTAASHASMFTSLVPSRHGTSMRENGALAEHFATLAEVLQKQGYATASFNGGVQLAPEVGLDQGFDLYHSSYMVEFDKCVDLALPWLKSRDLYFLFLHTYEVHIPYVPKPSILELFEAEYHGPLPKRHLHAGIIQRVNSGKIPISEADKRHIIACYDSGVRSMDNAFSRLVSELKRRGIYDRAMIIFTSDHGEELGEHGKMAWHSHTLYDELIKVPLIIKFPRGQYAGRVVDSQVRSMDIMPTLLDYLAVPCPDVQGTSLLPHIQGQGEHLVAVSELVNKTGRYPVVVRTPQWKLTDSRLIDLVADPGEWGAVDNEAVSRQLRRIREQAVGPQDVQGAPMKLEAHTEEELRALGYLN